MAMTARNTSTAGRLDRRPATDPSASREPQSDEAFLGALGNRVRALRDERRLSRKMLAEAADVSERYLAQLESGNGNASVILLRRVATALNVRMTYMLGADMSVERAQLLRFIDSLPEKRLQEVTHRLVSDFGADESVRRKRIALIGLRGAGKSTLGSALAKGLRRPFIEVDGEIERAAGMPLSEVFMLYGQPGYRNLERQCLEHIIASQNEVVMSVGGGVVSEADTYQLLLGNCFTIWIKASPAEHMSRVIAQGDMRPMRRGRTAAMEGLMCLRLIAKCRQNKLRRAVP
jgi:XRE family transcriptional regulator, aerobic/anaerobic benzoate catabolism transcriptional regulator